MDEGVATGVVKVSVGRRSEVKVIDLKNLAKTKPDTTAIDPQFKGLMLCPGGLRFGKGGLTCARE
jgi:hypothetical protein